MKKLSTGQDSTLKIWRENTVALYGDDSSAVKFLDRKIAEQGEDEQVLAEEGQLLMALNHIHEGVQNDKQ